MLAHEPLTVGNVTYTWDRGWGQPFDATDLGLATGGKTELGNTHGCIVVRPNGNILVNTDAEHAVVEFSPDGGVVGYWGKQFAGGLHGMCLRVEDGVEVLHMVHLRRREIIKTTVSGEVLWTLGWPEQSGVYANREQFNPTAVAVAPDGRIYVGDGYGESWVHVYDQDRNYLKSFGGPGSEDGKLAAPHGMSMDTRGDEPLLLVCDRENHRLQWFTLDGEFVRKMDYDLRRPCNAWPTLEGGWVIADLVGRISFLDASDTVIGHLGDNANPDLCAINEVARELWKDGEFLSPHSVCVDDHGDLYVMDWNSLGRISKLTRNK